MTTNNDFNDNQPIKEQIIFDKFEGNKKQISRAKRKADRVANKKIRDRNKVIARQKRHAKFKKNQLNLPELS